MNVIAIAQGSSELTISIAVRRDGLEKAGSRGTHGMPVVMKGSGAAGQWTDSFESDPAVIYALDRDYRLIHCNLAWDRFALENNGMRRQCGGTS